MSHLPWIYEIEIARCRCGSLSGCYSLGVTSIDIVRVGGELVGGSPASLGGELGGGSPASLGGGWSAADARRRIVGIARWRMVGDCARWRMVGIVRLQMVGDCARWRMVGDCARWWIVGDDPQRMVGGELGGGLPALSVTGRRHRSAVSRDRVSFFRGYGSFAVDLWDRNRPVSVRVISGCYRLWLPGWTSHGSAVSSAAVRQRITGIARWRARWRFAGIARRRFVGIPRRPAHGTPFTHCSKK